MEELPYFHVLDKAMQCKNSIGCKIKGKVTVNKVRKSDMWISHFKEAAGYESTNLEHPGTSVAYIFSL